ncbi:hypothetical protein C8J57DRAFT_1400370 [Mycena rebaudengoi]|nr:hypothetical protein C8J57DRAFT_1400370 [Mycena rebaudengoi]
MATKTTPPSSTLSHDLILEILDCLVIPLHLNQRSCDFPVLVACSTVCKSWSAHAQRLLFRRVILPNNMYSETFRRGPLTANRLPSFINAIDPATERGRWLAESMVSLTLRPTGRGRPTESTALATVLLRTPNLKHLDVTTNSCNFDEDILTRLRTDGPRITSLCIEQDFPFSADSGYNSSIMRQLIASFPSLRLFEMTTTNSSLLPFSPPLELSLVSVKFNTHLVEDIGPCLASLLRQDGHDEPLQLLRHESTSRIHAVLGPVLSDAETLAGELLAFPRLKVFIWTRCVQSGDLFHMLERRCAERGIAFCTYTGQTMNTDAIELELRRKYVSI